MQVDPRRRMSLTNALKHEWLREHLPFHGYPVTNDHDDYDAPMYPEDYHYDPDDLEEIEPTVPGPPRSQPLQRRSIVLAQAAEAGKNLPEPSSEMVAHAAAREDPPRTSNATGKGVRKRLRADLTPHPEDEHEDRLNTPGPAKNEKLNNVSNEGPTSLPRRSRRPKAARVA